MFLRKQQQRKRQSSSPRPARLGAAAASQVRRLHHPTPALAAAATAEQSSARMNARAAPSPAAAPRFKRVGSASSSAAAAAVATPPPLIPLYVHSDPLSRMTLPLLHLIVAHLAVADVHTFARANRVMCAATIASDMPWKSRWSRAQADERIRKASLMRTHRRRCACCSS